MRVISCLPDAPDGACWRVLRIVGAADARRLTVESWHASYRAAQAALRLRERRMPVPCRRTWRASLQRRSA